MKIACIGDNCIDWYVDTKKGSPGGNPVNVSVYSRRLGFDSSYIGVVGDDANGELIINSLKEKGVDVSHVRTVPGSTAVSRVRLKDGDRILGDYDEGVMADFCPTKEDIDFLCEHDMVVTSLWGHAEGALEEIHSRGIPVAFDASKRPFDEIALDVAPYVTLFFFSDDSADNEEIRDTLSKIHASGPKIAIAMRGSKGSMAYDGKEFPSFGIIPTEVVDTLGAGDSYIAGFTTAWLSRKSIPECMISGAECASETIRYTGAW